MQEPQTWVDIYNTGTNTWTQGADMPGARFWIDCEAISGKIYCGGGFSNRTESTLYIYDIAHNTWSTGPELPYGSLQLCQCNPKWQVLHDWGV